MAITPPADTSSLLVPIHLDAWVVNEQTQQLTAIYKADYTQLPQFKSLFKEPFSKETVKKSKGVHLHWALPDALTHGRTPATGGDETVFPFVPNRWLIARFTAETGTWQCKLWVVQSDYVGGLVGKTSDVLMGASEATVKLAVPGSQFKIAKGDKLQIVSPEGTWVADVEAAAPAAKDATAFIISPYNFSQFDDGDGLPAGSIVRLIASSAFLDPSDATTMKVAMDGKATFDVNYASIGKRHEIAAWQAAGGVDGEPLFLQAVGPGNVSFAAYMPTVTDVFSFTDSDLPQPGTGLHNYTYMVVGWYSDPEKGDPLRGVKFYDPAVWGAREDWQKQTPEQRMATLLSYLKWSVKDQNGKPVAAPPLSTSLYHGLLASVQWPPPSATTSSSVPAKIDSSKVHVAVGNTAADALAALVQSEARAKAAGLPDDRASQWIKAGDTLAQLMQAAMYDLLDKYDKPGGAALVEQQIEEAWYGSAPGGTIWDVVAASQSSPQANEPPELTPKQSEAVAAALAGLNSTQVAFDESMRALMSLQTQLYEMWWKVGRARSYGIYGDAPPTKPRWSVLKGFLLSLYEPLLKQTWKQYCAVEEARKALPNPTATDETDPRSPARWAQNNPDWLFPDAGGVPKKKRLAELGLYLKASAMPNFSHPSDPVLMISGLNRERRHGEDGRYNEDGTLTCRVPGESITGLNIQGQPEISKATVTAGGVNLAPCSFASVPNVPSLVAEAFFVDPANAAVMAKAIAGSDQAKIKTAITSLLDAKAAAGTSWAGRPPARFSVEAWDQAWSPLFLEWKVLYYPTGNDDFVFSPTDWQFDGAQYWWLGTGFNSQRHIDYSARTLLTPYAPLTFKAKIEKYLTSHQVQYSDKIQDLINTVGGWDILSQNLSGLTDQLITLISQETFPPPATGEQTVQCPPADKVPGVNVLIGNQYHNVPVVETTEPKAYFPVRAGFAQFSSLQIVDAFGQVYGGDDMSFWNNTTQGFEPTLGQGLGLSVASTLTPEKKQEALDKLKSTSARFQLPPRVVQNVRLDLDFLANDGSGKPATLSANPNPVCGWLVPNHLDGGISVYDGSGAPLGELLALPPGTKCDNWRPRPGAPGTKPPPACPVDIKNEALRSVVKSIAAQSTEVFRDLLNTIDETLWMVDPLGGRKDQFLSVLIGRPLAVVQLRLKLSLLGDPVFSQYWDRTSANPNAQNPSQCTQLKETGPVLKVNFPVRLGSLELREDGLIGYYLSTENYANFYTVHYPDRVAASDKYLRRIVDPKPLSGSAPFQGNVSLKCNGDAVTVTMLIDPRGRVHAYSGILPVVSAALPGQLVEEFIRGLQVTFRTGPVVADPSTMRIPQPAEEHGVWSWVQAVTPPTSGRDATWFEAAIVNADDQARMPDAQLQLREGWLKLSGLEEPTR